MNFEKVSIVLVGKTGAGKSSTANSLVGKQDTFATDWGQTRTTQKNQNECTQIDDVEVNVVDTPGFCDILEPTTEITRAYTERSNLKKSQVKEHQEHSEKIKNMEVQQDVERQENVKKLVAECIMKTSHTRVHAFLLVMKWDDRLDKAYKETLNSLSDLFGADHFHKYVFLTFTRTDSMKEQKITEEAFQEKLHPITKDYLKNCAGIIFVDNKLLGNSPKNCEQWRSNVLEKVLHNVKYLGRPYSSGYFEENRLKPLIIKMEDSFKNYAQKCGDIEAELEKIAAKSVESSKTRNKIKIAAGAQAIAGSVVGMGLALAIPSGGLSLIAALGGSGIMMSGKITSIVTRHLEIKETMKLREESETWLRDLEAATLEYNKDYDKLCDEFKSSTLHISIKSTADNYTFLNESPSALSDIGSSGRTASQFADGILAFSGNGELLGRKPGPVLKSLVAAAVFDLNTILNAAENIKEGNLTELAKDLKRLILASRNNREKLQEEKNFLLDIVNKFCKDSDGFLSKGCACIECKQSLREPVVCKARNAKLSHWCGCKTCIMKVEPPEGATIHCPVCNSDWVFETAKEPQKEETIADLQLIVNTIDLLSDRGLVEQHDDEKVITVPAHIPPVLVDEIAKSKPLRILCIDGGGSRGIVAATILGYIEKESNCNLSDTFDLVVGTSAGAIVGAGIALLQMKGSECVEVASEMASKTFGETWLKSARLLFGRTRYREHGLEQFLNELLKTSEYKSRKGISYVKGKRSQAVFCAVSNAMNRRLTRYEPRVLVANCIDTHAWFTSTKIPLINEKRIKRESKLEKTVTIILRASTAAPTFLPPKSIKYTDDGDQMLEETFVDGGIGYNNPSRLALEIASSLFPGREIGVLLSIGTGKSPFEQPDSMETIATDHEAWDAVKFLTHTITSSQRIHLDMLSPNILHPAGFEVSRGENQKYFRFSPELQGDLALDTTDKQQLNKWKVQTSRYMAEQKVQTSLLTDRLKFLGKVSNPIERIHSGTKKGSDVDAVDSTECQCDASELDIDFDEGCGEIRNLVVKKCKKVPTNSVRDNAYPNFTDPKGVALIIVNHFAGIEGLDRWPGSKCDIANLQHTLKQLGYIIRLHEDKTAKEMMECVKEFQHLDWNLYDSALVFISSHGNECGLLGNDKRSVNPKFLVSCLEPTNCSKLALKPKLFFFQACRGDYRDEGVRTEFSDLDRQSSLDETKDQSDKEVVKVSHHGHTFEAYASHPGYVSYRPRTGSLFIYGFCQVVANLAFKYDIHALLVRVSDYVNNERSKLKTGPAFQVVQQTSSLMKDFYFFPGVKHSIPGDRTSPLCVT